MSKISVTIDGVAFDVEVQLAQDGTDAVVVVNGETLRVALPRLDSPEQVAWAVVEGRPYEVVVDRYLHWIRSPRGPHTIELRDMETATARPASGDGRVKAPIPGQIARLMVGQGDRVEAGQPLLVLEAMKMENEIRAPRPGVIGQLNVAPGQTVTLNMVMAEIV